MAMHILSTPPPAVTFLLVMQPGGLVGDCDRYYHVLSPYFLMLLPPVLPTVDAAAATVV